MNIESILKRALFVIFVLYIVYHVDAVRDLVMGA